MKNAKRQDNWDAKTYERFLNQRLQPFHELLNLVEPENNMVIVDLGCGTGEATVILHNELNAARSLGIDNSDSMLEQASTRVADGLSFCEGDFTRFTADSSYDLVFSNAALHWATEQEQVLTRWFAVLKPGGQLAVQLSANQPHVTHSVARELGKTEPYANVIDGRIAQPGALEVERYAEILHSLEAVSIHVRMQVFSHELKNTNAAADWVKGALLTGYKRMLGDELYTQFETEYRRLLLKQAGDYSPYRLTIRRILFHARKAG